jgi:two-component system sensor histidine kinase UhpB
MFWRGSRPDIMFSTNVAVDEARIGSDLRETIYRVVQEGISNAIRHGRPAHVTIAITGDRADGIHVEVTDDGVGMTEDGNAARGTTQLGLIGMRERVAAMAGSLSIQPGTNRKGMSLIVHLPDGGRSMWETTA